MLIKYKIERHGDEIISVLVTKETDHTVTLPDDAREHKSCQWHTYFDDFESAKEKLLKQNLKSLQALKYQIKLRRKSIKKIKAANKP